MGEEALVKKERKQAGRKRRTWIMHHAKLQEYFDMSATEESDVEPEAALFPDIDEMARSFVRQHLQQRQREMEMATTRHSDPFLGKLARS